MRDKTELTWWQEALGLRSVPTETKCWRLKTYVEQKWRKHRASSILAVTSQVIVTLTQRSQSELVFQYQSFSRLQNFWKSQALQNKTKLNIYKSDVYSVLLCSRETWRTNKKIESSFRGFSGRCFDHILRTESDRNSVLLKKKLAEVLASTTMWKMWNRDTGDDCYGWTRPGIHTVHLDGHH